MARNTTHAAKPSARALAFAALAAAAITTVGGCSAGNSQASIYNDMKRDLTPELRTLVERPVDIDNTLTRTNDVYGRLFWEDLGKLGLQDRPSRLNRFNIVE